MGSIVAIVPLMNDVSIEEKAFGQIEPEIDGDEFMELVQATAQRRNPSPTSHITAPVQQAPVQHRTVPPPAQGGGSGIPIGNVGGAIAMPINVGSGQQPADPNTGVTIPGGEGTWGSGGGFGESGWGAGGGFGGGGGGFGGDDSGAGGEAESTAIGTDPATGCPIYGYNEQGQALYGVDQNGNIITDPSVLPCAMRVKGEDSGKGKKDNTLLYVLLGLGAATGLYLMTRKKK